MSQFKTKPFHQINPIFEENGIIMLGVVFFIISQNN